MSSRKPVNPYAPGASSARRGGAPSGDDEPYTGGFWRDIPTALLVPFHPGRLVLTVIAGLAIWLVGHMPIIGLMLHYALTMLFFAVWVQSAADGRQDIMPPMSDLNAGELFGIAVRALIGCLPVFLPLLLVNYGINPWLIVAWIVLTLPAMLITLAMTDGLLDAGNPLYWLRIVLAEPVAFVVAAVIFIALSYLGNLAAIWVGAHVPVALVGMASCVAGIVPSVSGAHVLGAYVNCFRDELTD